ncbi:hypothetical protein GCM10027053_24570 [Intrasporangium mesophilum]
MSDDELTDRLRDASDSEREDILEELRRAAEESGDLTLVNRLALAYAELGRTRVAAAVWEQLLALASGEPIADIARMSLGTAYDTLGFAALSRYHFLYLAAEGASDELREIGKDQLSRLDEEQAAFAAARERHRQEFTDALSRAERTADLVDLETVGTLLPEFIRAEPSTDRVARIRGLLDAAAKRYPYSIGLLVGLMFCAAELNDRAALDEVNGRMDEAIRAGAAYALPDDVAALLARQKAQGTPTAAAAHLFRLVQERDTELADAALADLGQLADDSPRDEVWRFAYCFGLLARGRAKDLPAQVERLVSLDQPTHSYHYNAGQLFFAAGDLERGRRSLLLALELARDEDDVADAKEALATYGIDP